MTDNTDCAIIGAGPAGLVAALYLLRFRRTVLIADKGSSRAALIPHSHNYPGFPDGVSGADLLERLHRQIRRYGTPTQVGAALRVEAAGDHWRVVTAEGVKPARRVLFATGVVDRWPDLLGARQAVDRGVLRFCPVCDGFEIQEQRVGIIGNDDHAAREALFVRCYTPSVSLLSDTLHVTPGMHARLMAQGVDIVSTLAGSLRFVDGAIYGADARGAELAPFSVVYGALGVDPQSQLLAPLGVRLDAGGCLGVDAHQQTSRPGLYAAGDVVRGLDQISVAVGEAAIAATAIHNSLREEDS